MLVSNGVRRDRIILSIDAYKKVLGPMIMTIIKLLRLRNCQLRHVTIAGDRWAL
jgi:hypothetical protein